MDRNASPRTVFGGQDLGLITGQAAQPVRRKGRRLIRLGIALLVAGVACSVGGFVLISVSGRSSDAGGYTLTRLPFPEPAVTIAGTDGTIVPLEAPGHDRLSSTPGLDAVGISEFAAPADGTYTVSVVGVAGAVSTVVIDEADSLWKSAEPWIRSSVVTSVGGVLMTIGVLVLVGGIVRSTLGAGLGDLRRLGRMR